MTEQQKKDIAAMREYESRIYSIRHAMSLLNVDGETIAPKCAHDGIAKTLGVLSGIMYETVQDPKNRELIDRLYHEREELDPVSKREAYLLGHDAERMSKIPAEEYAAQTVLLNRSVVEWKKAKETNDFSHFAPWLQQVIDSLVRVAGYTDPERDPYNAMLNEYEEGLNTDTLDAFFKTLREAIVPLLKRVMSAPQIDNSCLRQEYPIDDQRRFSEYLMEACGIDKDKCILGETEHPFTEGFSSQDLRITTNYGLYDVSDSMYSVIHEGGHAMYEMDVNPDYDYTALGGGASMSIHESQSRFYENIIGRSRGFVEHIFPKVKEFFPKQLGNTSAETFFRAVNRVEPSLIRTEADELTYCLHIMVRYELEKQLVAGTLKVEDLPTAWNEKYKEYLGIDVPDDAHGVLQDTHWASGLIGYFPSYALGSAYGAQMLHCMKEAVPDLESRVAAGDITPVRKWLKENIHQYGHLYTPTELFDRACGKFDPQYYIDYLTEKYEALYGLK